MYSTSKTASVATPLSSPTSEATPDNSAETDKHDDSVENAEKTKSPVPPNNASSPK